jgi:hypothetical protein
MELFIKECHEKQKLVVHGSAIPRMLLDEFRRESIPINNLQQYGLFQYVLDTVQGPDPILRYLCQTIKIHMIPIGNEAAMTNVDEITKKTTIRRFFVKNFCVCLDSIWILTFSFLFSIHHRFHIILVYHRQLMFMYKRKNI